MLPETHEFCTKCGRTHVDLAVAIDDAESDLRGTTAHLEELSRTLAHEKDLGEKRDAAEQMLECAEKVVPLLDKIERLWKLRDGH